MAEIRSVLLVADYGDGLAFTEVEEEIRDYCGPNTPISRVPVTRFSTIATGFAIAQLCRKPRKRPPVVYFNTDPRAEDEQPRPDNGGAPLVYFRTRHGAEGIGPNAGHVLAILREQIAVLHLVRYDRLLKSPFNSRDAFPAVLQALLNRTLFHRGCGTLPCLGDALDPSDTSVIRPLPQVIRTADGWPTCAGWKDGYGNVKLTMQASTLVGVDFGTVLEAQVIRRGTALTREPVSLVYLPGDFHGHANSLALVRGSSGPANDPYLELFLRCRHPHDPGAADVLGGVQDEDVVLLNLRRRA